LSVVNKFSDLH